MGESKHRSEIPSLCPFSQGTPESPAPSCPTGGWESSAPRRWPVSGHRASRSESKLRFLLSIYGKAAESHGSKKPPFTDCIMPHVLAHWLDCEEKKKRKIWTKRWWSVQVIGDVTDLLGDSSLYKSKHTPRGFPGHSQKVHSLSILRNKSG